MSGKKTLRLRFTFNQQTGKAGPEKFKSAARQFANVVVRDFAFSYSDELYQTLKNRVGQVLKTDVNAELKHQARLYARIIIGVGAGQKGPSGQLTTKAEDGPTSDINRAIPSWAPRKARYLRRKQRQVGHKRWFEHSGYLQNAFRKSVLLEYMFGPIAVRMSRKTSVSATDASQKDYLSSVPKRFSSAADYGKLRVGVAKIEVSALSDITPAMLPALLSDNPRDIGRSGMGGSAIMNKIYAYDRELGYRMGGNSQNTPYRPTLEPFLAFALTRSIPYAVKRRVETGLQGKLFGKSVVGTAGRV